MIASLGGEIDALTLSSLSVPCQRTWFNFSAIITSKLWGSKAAFTIVFFAAFDHNFDYKQQILKHRNAQNGFKSTNHNSQTKTFWTPWSTLLFPKRSAKMIGGSNEECKFQLAIELQNSLVFEKHGKANLSYVQ